MGTNFSSTFLVACSDRAGIESGNPDPSSLALTGNTYQPHSQLASYPNMGLIAAGHGVHGARRESES